MWNYAGNLRDSLPELGAGWEQNPAPLLHPRDSPLPPGGTLMLESETGELKPTVLCEFSNSSSPISFLFWKIDVIHKIHSYLQHIHTTNRSGKTSAIYYRSASHLSGLLHCHVTNPFLNGTMNESRKSVPSRLPNSSKRCSHHRIPGDSARVEPASWSPPTAVLSAHWRWVQHRRGSINIRWVCPREK